MACPGGCIAGGGQPYHHGDVSILEKRKDAIYRHERSKKIRSAHRNPRVIQLYNEFLGKPLGEKSLNLLHTSYVYRPKM